MNDFSEIEDQLRKLRPIVPSPELVDRIERELAEAVSTTTAGVLPRQRRLRANWLALGLGLAAAATFLIFAHMQGPRPTGKTPAVATVSPLPIAPAVNASAEFELAGLTRVVYRTRDEGLQYRSGSNEPVRRMRSRSRETLQWRNPKTGASLRVSYPSEEVSLIPVSGQ